MEGPSLIIAREELARFVGRRVKEATGALASQLQGRAFTGTQSWGKHLILLFSPTAVRIHFLMFGSYRIDDRRDDKEPKLGLRFTNGEINFYTCAVKVLDEDPDDLYDWSIDVLSDEWDPAAAVKRLRARPAMQVADALMDQAIFAGVGNIIKNEVLYRLRIHPETPIGALTATQQRRLVAETRIYCEQFYAWKKKNELKRNWKIFRKRKCPTCGANVTKAKTGVSQRVSHWCETCQPAPAAQRRGRLRSSSVSSSSSPSPA